MVSFSENAPSAHLDRIAHAECEMCGESGECYNVGSVGYPEARCAKCYADGIGHGCCYGTAGEAMDAVVDALGCEQTPELMSIVAAYF